MLKQITALGCYFGYQIREFFIGIIIFILIIIPIFFIFNSVVYFFNWLCCLVFPIKAKPQQGLWKSDNSEQQPSRDWVGKEKNIILNSKIENKLFHQETLIEKLQEFHNNQVKKTIYVVKINLAKVLL